MTNPILYDVRRTLTSKSVLIVMALLILLGFAIIPSFSLSTVGNQPPTYTDNQAFVYYDANGYHFLVFAWNQFGQAVSGVKFISNVTSSPSNVVKVLSNSGTTNSSGDAQFTVALPKMDSSYSVSISVEQPNGVGSFVSGGYFTPFQEQFPNGTQIITPSGQAVAVLGGFSSTVYDSSNSSQRQIQVSWVGPNGAAPLGYQVYYEFFNVTETCQVNGNSRTCSSGFTPPSTLNRSEMHSLGVMNSYRQIFQAPPLASNLSDASFLLLGLFYPNGTSVATSQQGMISVYELYPNAQQQITPIQGSQLVVQFFVGIFGLFIPLMAIVGAYNSYGKDRVSGVLESVLAQPVSRKGLSLSRYFSSFIAMAIAISVSVGVMDVIAWSATKSFVDSAIILSSIGAFFVELAAFIGIMMLFSHLVRSSGALIGIGIGLFVVMDFFWGFIILILSQLAGIQFNSAGYYQVAVIAEFVNPAQFVSLVNTYLSHFLSLGGIGGFPFPITPADYGVTIPSIVAAGILWIGLPLIGFLYLATKRD